MSTRIRHLQPSKRVLGIASLLGVVVLVLAGWATLDGRQAPAPQLAAISPQELVSTPPGVSAPVQTGPSGLPIPRYVSLKAERVNVRQGPSMDHAILWTFVRPGLPVEVIAEFESWRRVRDSAGDVGWVKQQMISGRRTVVIRGDDHVPLMDKPKVNGRLLANCVPGLVANLESCRGPWCEVSVRGYQGYIPRSRLWGVYPGE